MTNVLLDTNAFAMALTDDPRLPPPTRQRLLEATRAAVSVISFYEIGQKVRLGKWPEMTPHMAELETRVREDGYDLLPLTARAALDSSILDWNHRYPFDRMIATVARLENLPLISADTAFDELNLTRIWS